MKTNLVHTLFRVRKYGVMSLDKFSELLTAADMKKCKRAQKKTWYSLTLDVFTTFMFQVRHFNDSPNADVCLFRSVCSNEKY